MVLCSSFLTSWELSPCRPSAMGKSLSLKRFCRWAPRADRLRHSSAPQAQRWRAACGAGHLRIVPIKHVKHCETYVKVRSFWMSKGNPNKHLRQTHIYIYSREGDTKEVLWRTLRSHPTLHARKKKNMARPWFLPRDSWLTLSSWPWEHWNISWLLLSNPWKVVTVDHHSLHCMRKNTYLKPSTSY